MKNFSFVFVIFFVDKLLGMEGPSLSISLSSDRDFRRTEVFMQNFMCEYEKMRVAVSRMIPIKEDGAVDEAGALKQVNITEVKRLQKDLEALYKIGTEITGSLEAEGKKQKTNAVRVEHYKLCLRILGLNNVSDDLEALLNYLSAKTYEFQNNMNLFKNILDGFIAEDVVKSGGVCNAAPQIETKSSYFSKGAVVGSVSAITGVVLAGWLLWPKKSMPVVPVTVALPIVSATVAFPVTPPVRRISVPGLKMMRGAVPGLLLAFASGVLSAVTATPSTFDMSDIATWLMHFNGN